MHSTIACYGIVCFHHDVVLIANSSDCRSARNFSLCISLNERILPCPRTWNSLLFLYLNYTTIFRCKWLLKFLYYNVLVNLHTGTLAIGFYTSYMTLTICMVYDSDMGPLYRQYHSSYPGFISTWSTHKSASVRIPILHCWCWGYKLLPLYGYPLSIWR